MSNSQGLKRLINLIKHQYNFQVTVFENQYFYCGFSSEVTIAQCTCFTKHRKNDQNVSLLKSEKRRFFLIIDQMFVQEFSFESDIGLEN